MSTGAFAEGPPAEAFAELPAMQSPSLSADGTRLAFISHASGESFVLVSDLEDMSVTAGLELEEGKLRSVFWANDEALVFTAGTATTLVTVPGRVEATSPYGVDLTEDANVVPLLDERARLTRRGGGGAARIGGYLAVDGAQLIGHDRDTGRVLYPKYDIEGERILYAIDPKTGRRDVLDRGSRFTRDWVADESGEPVFRVDYAQRSDQLSLLARDGRAWASVISERIDIPELSMFGLNAAGDLVVGTRPDGVDTFGLYALSTETGELDEPLLTHERFDVTSVRTDPYTNRVVGGGFAETGPVWLDEELAEHQALLDEAFPGERPAIVSWSENRRRMIVVTESAQRAPAVYLYDARAGSVTQIASVYTSLQGVSLPERREYSYTARDGTVVPGYVTRPADASGPTPAVILPHGGPATRDVPGFDWLAQFLGSRGYTVLQPNFRGSGGYGDAWETAGHGQWGIGVMQHDVSDGVAALVADGLADAERICIVGASYGGYAALAGAVFTPELYRCAVSIAGVADLVDMLSFEQGRRGSFSATLSYWRRAAGGGDDTDGLNDRLRAASPAVHAEQARAPILLIHGRDDAVVPLEQSRIMERALSAAGKRVELVELDGEDHWLSGPATRLATLEALERFLGEHLED